ncbi:glycoside hydrolase family 32 protein [Streptomyces sp. NPDC000349]|uniref:glycoside hydrolase family 32 protein n=1 Tax=unclassified Streptomyces TaxID=2593676 RepID=UPI002787961E|nr:glycoside hydrolase family 32 protein [Streptomyces sp. DSM 40167]MDQ0406811.1 beta-fructofuranosidase [Streptomyces sp. DSM 40167]
MSTQPAPPQLDPHAPRFRVRPPANWINDPNGPFRWRGRYHLFYQHNPDAPVHTNMHWGHVSSADLVRWEHHPLALTPTPGGPDEGGCWSGCVVDDAGVPTAVYTGVDHAHTGLGTICLAHASADSPELTTWRTLPEPVVSGPPPGLDVTMFRDPFVLRHGGRRWALVGAGHADGTPSVLLYACDDLTSWRFAGVLVDGHDPVAQKAFGDGAVGWECPQLFEGEGGDWTLVMSLWDGSPLSTVYLTGRLLTLDQGDLTGFAPQVGGPLDLGRDCYAPAVLHDSEAGRNLLWGWSWEARGQREVDHAGWSGVLTAPRVVGTHPDGTVRVSPAPELQLLRAQTPFVTEPEGRTPLPLAYDIEVTAVTSTTLTLLRAASGAELTLTLDPAAGTATLDRTSWPRERPGGSAPITLTSTPTPPAGLDVRILVDGSLLELFVADRAVATERIYRRPDDVAELTVAGEGARVTGWEVVPPGHE